MSNAGGRGFDPGALLAFLGDAETQCGVKTSAVCKLRIIHPQMHNEFAVQAGKNFFAALLKVIFR